MTEHSRIHILDQHTANQIAAGEVVERPFSVIKELVENALDAGATHIDIRIFDAQLEKMQVADNGCGMSAEEMRLAVLRHATSKIRQAADLDHLQTLGFRGEALPSIGSVSHLTLTSRQKGAEEGYSMTVKDGKAGIPQPAPSRVGTTVLVDRLFYNTPARKKFLKSPRTELGLISDLISRYIVAYPKVSFHLTSGSHQILASSGQGDARAALFEACGKAVAEQMISFSQGFVSPPALNRGNRNQYSFFLNGRPVRSRELSNVVDEAYFNFLPERRYPIVFLFLQVDPELVDVNVHPGKLEVKFRNFAPIKEQLLPEIRDAVGKSMASAPRVERGWESSGEEPEEEFRPEPLPQQQPALMREPMLSPGRDLNSILYAKARETRTPTLGDFGEKPAEAARLRHAEPGPVQEQLFPEPSFDGDKRIRYGDLTPLGQFAGTFVVCTCGEYLYLIDQHAAAERILYEKIAANALENGDASAQLAVPISVELSFSESILLTDSCMELREQGFILEHFGENSFIIRGVPLWYSGDDPEQLLRLFLDEIREDKTNVARIRKEELFRAACKQAVKANRYLTPADISALLRQLDHCENAATCPHGRPLAIRISRSEVYKRFLRGSI